MIVVQLLFFLAVNYYIQSSLDWHQFERKKFLHRITMLKKLFFQLRCKNVYHRFVNLTFRRMKCCNLTVYMSKEKIFDQTEN